MVFIVGAGRSGTTLLRLMLDRHSKVYSGPEDQLALVHLLRWHRIDPSVRRFVDELYSFQTANGPLVELWGIAERRTDLAQCLEKAIDAARPAFASRVAVLRAAVLEALAPEAEVWCIKTPNYALHPAVIEQSCPDAVVLHLVRDGRDVARSYLEGPLRWHIRPPTYARAAAMWRRSNRLAASIEERGRLRYHRLRYEDLVNQPRPVLQGVCDAVGLELEESMLEHQTGNEGLAKIPKTERAWHQSTQQPVHNKRVGLGKQSMSPEQHRDFVGVAGADLESYGYSLDGVRPSAIRSGLYRMQSWWLDTVERTATSRRWLRRRFSARSSRS